MDVIIIVDMQVGLLSGAPKYDLAGVTDRINKLTAMVRRRSGKVVWIRHCGQPDTEFAPNTPGWVFLPELLREPSDVIVDKTLNDPFAGTNLHRVLSNLAPERVLVTGWATDFCVDATVRSAVSNNYHVVAVSDAHTLSDRPHLDAQAVIRHHNWLWADLITNSSVDVLPTRQLLEEAGSR